MYTSLHIWSGDKCYLLKCCYLLIGRLKMQCFDTVGWVIWPVKPVPDTIYNVFGGTLSLTQSISQSENAYACCNRYKFLLTLEAFCPALRHLFCVGHKGNVMGQHRLVVVAQRCWHGGILIGNWQFCQVLAEFITQLKQKLSMIDTTRASTFMLYMLNSRNAAIFFSRILAKSHRLCIGAYVILNLCRWRYLISLVWQLAFSFCT